jgi:hypothetical protein
VEARIKQVRHERVSGIRGRFRIVVWTEHSGEAHYERHLFVRSLIVGLQLDREAVVGQRRDHGIEAGIHLHWLSLWVTANTSGHDSPYPTKPLAAAPAL